MTQLDFRDKFEDNPAIRGREDRFIVVEAKIAPILASWRESLFAHEWLLPDGTIKTMTDMTAEMRERRHLIEIQLQNSQPLQRPVLGIGITDNVEIGDGRDLLLHLASKGIKTIPVHIPKSHKDDFRIFIS